MKQLIIFVSPDLEDRVVRVLEHARVEGFLRLEGATGNKFIHGDPLTRIVTWEAVALIVPGANDAQVKAVLGELEEHAGVCEAGPCLRIVVSGLDYASSP